MGLTLTLVGEASVGFLHCQAANCPRHPGRDTRPCRCPGSLWWGQGWPCYLLVGVGYNSCDQSVHLSEIVVLTATGQLVFCRDSCPHPFAIQSFIYINVGYNQVPSGVSAWDFLCPHWSTSSLVATWATPGSCCVFPVLALVPPTASRKGLFF